MTPHRLAVVTGAAFLLTGCGDGGGGSDDDRLTPMQYEAQATKICTDREKEIKAVDRPEKVEDIKPVLQQLIDITQKTLDQFKGLRPPESLEEKHNAVVDALQTALDKLQQVSDSLTRDDSDLTKVREAQPEVNQINEDIIEKLDAAGLPRCASE